MRIVIVGGAGFLGCTIAARLKADGHSLVVLDTAPRLGAAGERLDGMEQGAFDFARDPDPSPWLEGAQALVHLGCTTNPGLSMQDLAYDAESNIGTSVRLFGAAARAGIRRAVFASSGGTIYGAPRQLPVTEDHGPGPLSGYGVSKWAIERYLALHDSLQGVSLRVSNPYGPHQLAGATVGVIARYVASVAAGEPLQVWGDGSIVRDYIAIDDVAEAFAIAATAGALAHDTYNIGSGQGQSVNQVIEAVFRACGRQVPVQYLPGRPFDVPAIVLDSSRFARETGWSARIGLDEGVAGLWAECLRRGKVA